MSNTLLPCPFCGGEVDIEEISGNPFTNEPYTWAVGCKDCNIGWYKETKEDAIAAWNRRADAVQVVRCKECEDYNTVNCSEGFGWCENMDRGTHDEFYCANGKQLNKEREVK